jgi:hypothetical protein
LQLYILIGMLNSVRYSYFVEQVKRIQTGSTIIGHRTNLIQSSTAAHKWRHCLKCVYYPATLCSCELSDEHSG